MWEDSDLVIVGDNFGSNSAFIEVILKPLMSISNVLKFYKPTVSPRQLIIPFKHFEPIKYDLEVFHVQVGKYPLLSGLDLSNKISALQTDDLAGSIWGGGLVALSTSNFPEHSDQIRVFIRDRQIECKFVSLLATELKCQFDKFTTRIEGNFTFEFFLKFRHIHSDAKLSYFFDKNHTPVVNSLSTKEASGGMTLTVTGSGFDSKEQIVMYFGDISVVCSVVSVKSLTVEVPFFVSSTVQLSLRVGEKGFAEFRYRSSLTPEPALYSPISSKSADFTKPRDCSKREILESRDQAFRSRTKWSWEAFRRLSTLTQPKRSGSCFSKVSRKMRKSKSRERRAISTCARSAKSIKRS